MTLHSETDGRKLKALLDALTVLQHKPDDEDGATVTVRLMVPVGDKTPEQLQAMVVDALFALGADVRGVRPGW